MKKEIIKVIVILGLVSNLSANIAEAIGGAIIEVAMPIVIEVSLKSKNQRKADAARAQGQWKKFTHFLGFTDKEQKTVQREEVNTTDWSEEADWGEE